MISGGVRDGSTKIIFSRRIFPASDTSLTPPDMVNAEEVDRLIDSNFVSKEADFCLHYTDVSATMLLFHRFKLPLFTSQFSSSVASLCDLDNLGDELLIFHADQVGSF